MRDLNLILFDKLREYDRYMRMGRGPGVLLASNSNDGAPDTPAFQRDVVLVLLSEHKKGLRQKQLAEHMRISPSTLSVMLDKLEADEYLERGSDSADKRVTVLMITEKGKKRAEEVHQQCAVMRENLFRNLEDSEKEELIRLMDKILGNENEAESKKTPAIKAHENVQLQVIGEGMSCRPDGCCIR